ncbi:Auxin transporter-like protein 1 [Nymphaea thermarum]|nr:Auxin transporter-like protein 1 [Nymphaea thermarum]
MNSNWDKRQWLDLFGTLAIPIVLIPSVHNFRIVSILGIATTSLTSAYMTVASIQHGQVENVHHQGPKNMVDFFTGATNILFSFGSHGLCIELMEAMWRPKKYKYAYACAVLYTYLLTISDSIAVYWPYGDILLHRSNAFGYVTFLLNVNPLFLAWEKLTCVHLKKFALRALVRVPVVLVIWFLALAIPFFGPLNSVMGAFLISFSVYIIPSFAFMKSYKQRQFIMFWVFIFGFGFGGWASMTNFVQQIQSFGFFDKCYQCPTKHYAASHPDAVGEDSLVYLPERSQLIDGCTVGAGHVHVLGDLLDEALHDLGGGHGGEAVEGGVSGGAQLMVRCSFTSGLGHLVVHIRCRMMPWKKEEEGLRA